jgi:hypothetical protein
VKAHALADEMDLPAVKLTQLRRNPIFTRNTESHKGNKRRNRNLAAIIFIISKPESAAIMDGLPLALFG